MRLLGWLVLDWGNLRLLFGSDGAAVQLKPSHRLAAQLQRETVVVPAKR